MAKIKYDLTEASAGSDFIPAGAHKAIIKKVESTTSKEAKTPMLKITLKTKEGNLITNVMLAGKGAFRFLELASCIKLVVKEQATGILDTDKLMDKKVGIVVKQSEYNGDTRSEVDKFIPYTAVDAFQVPADDFEDEDEEDDFEDDEVVEVKKSKKKPKAKKKVIEDEDDFDDLEEDDEEEDEPAPKKKTKTKAKTKTKKKVDEDEDEDEFDIDFDDED